MEFSPLKTNLVEMDGLVDRVIELAKQNKVEESAQDRQLNLPQESEIRIAKSLLRHHALVAIKNLTFWSSSALKQKTVQSLGWDHIVRSASFNLVQ